MTGLEGASTPRQPLTTICVGAQTMAAKKCSKCGAIKPLEHFYKHSDGRFGRRPDCISCHQARSRSYALSHSKEISEWRKKYRKENIERHKERNRAYYASNKCRWVEYEKRRRNDPSYRIMASESQRRWRIKNKDQKNVWTRNRRAKIKALSGSHSLADIIRILEMQKGKCVYCRCSLANAYHVDHVMPIALGGSNDPSNLQVLCKTCNLKKNKKHPIQFNKELGLLL